ncbi:polysaccharide pyruvyl transferase family protein [Clostridium butyricum]|uniref:polysaccharide pyruvyl transferase family protein n=1 Tax=Clostridium butyricum TaxID=1492 RepID=UPI00374EF79B
MRVAIVTITNGENYGNRLQNYAVQQQLEKENIHIETLRNKSGQSFSLIRSVKKLLKNTIFYCKYKNEINRKKYFHEFNNNYIVFSKYEVSNSKIPKKINEKFDLFICGSDQIWNPNYEENAEVNFLQFTSRNKKVSFAASFGANNIPEHRKHSMSIWLNDFKYISVREDSGKNILKQLTNRDDVEVLVDPTMLITAQEWDKLCKKPKQLKSKKFILNYFLGEISYQRKKQIEIIAKENECEIINLMDKRNIFYQTGPSEFLYLEKNAFLICTDSFHSCVFAILYNTPFIVFEREDNTVSMNSRIDTLLRKFKLEDRRFKECIDNEQLKCDYSIAHKLLKEERKKSDRFLNKILT